MAVPVLAFIALAGIAEIGKGIFQTQAAEQQEEALNLKSDLQVLQYQQKKLSTYSLLEKTLATQTAQATTRGVALSSASFNAIQRETVNIGSRELSNLDVEQDIMGRNIKIEKSNVRKTLYAQLFGDAADIGIAAAKVL